MTHRPMVDLGDCVGFDLELDSRSRLTVLGAVRGPDVLTRDAGTDPTSAVRSLDHFAAQATFVFGHNILWHDLPWLARRTPTPSLCRKPAVDTLVLSALAFAEHPYHALVKDYKLTRYAANDPTADARIARIVLTDARVRLREIATTQPVFGRAVHTLAVAGLRAVSELAAEGMALTLEGVSEPSADLDGDLAEALAGRACLSALEAMRPVAQQPADVQLALVFVVAWLRVAGAAGTTSRSVMMRWVRRELPQVHELIRRLRDHRCDDPRCDWCMSVHDPRSQLQRWFKHPDFRAEPALTDGRGVQRAAVEAGLADKPFLALLPTGGGKSLCFQLPAIARYQRRGALTVVISPLQSLMHDQVDNFTSKTGLSCAVALSGRLTPPERRAALDAVRMGDAGLLYVSPEQLRNRTFRAAVALREIGAWVFDEAHCLSKWGHDFRPDYLYAARFIRKFSEDQKTASAPIVCVTATAKVEVVRELREHFRTELNQELELFDGQGPRHNLTLRAEHTSDSARASRLGDLVAGQLVASPSGSVLVYTTTRSSADQAAAFLNAMGIEAEAFHAGLDVPVKKAVQERFLRGERRVVCATNAFGMGIDKPDIRLVLHYQLPGSIESYLQEVGRAGRDGRAAEAVLLFSGEDIETQFRLAARSRLELRDLKGVLRRVRFLARQVKASDERETVCTTGEILRDEELAERIEPSDRSSPTRVITALAWLERGKFLRRDDNSTSVFQGRPLVKSVEEARERIGSLGLPAGKAAAWLAILGRLMNAESDAGLSSDDLVDLHEARLVLGSANPTHAGRAVLRMLLEMQRAQLISAGMGMTAFVRHGVVSPSTTKLQEARKLEERFLALLREHEHDPEEARFYELSLASMNQKLVQLDATITFDRLLAVLRSMTDRSAHAGHNAPGLYLRSVSRDHCELSVRGGWDQVFAASRHRHVVADQCLRTLLGQLDGARPRGAALLVEFTLEQLVSALDQDLEIRSRPARDVVTEVEYGLLFLHRIGAIVLHKGLAVFRQAMVLRVPNNSLKRKYTQDDFRPLAEHQSERTTQIHAMHELARRLVTSPAEGERLIADYFTMANQAFLARHFAGRSKELSRSTGARSWERIMGSLNRDQRKIVEAPDDGSLLVLAGPGSGKTRVVVHRCAFLLRVRRLPASAILVLCFNRSAALELRRRLRDLVGEDANGILVQTYHGMAARLAGRAPAELLDRPTSGGPKGQDGVFDEVMRAAITLLEAGNAAVDRPTGDSDDAPDNDDLRDRLLAGFSHILVDEYQDIDEQQYRLVSAIAGRTLRDEDQRATVLAVGDDDQNVYHWRGSNVAFLRLFESDYRATRMSLVENYRSTAHIIAAANQLIALNDDRMKLSTPVRVDTKREQSAHGGRFESLDPEARGRVRVLHVATLSDQPSAAVSELVRLHARDPELSWDQCAVLAPTHASLDALRALCEAKQIPVRYRVDKSHAFSLYRLREVQSFLELVDAHPVAELDAAALTDLAARLLALRPGESAVALVDQTVGALIDEFGGRLLPKSQVREFFGELLLEQRRERTLGRGVMLGTVHGSKGAEYDHVILLAGGWRPRTGDTLEANRRLHYVGMTRARHTLAIVDCASDGSVWTWPRPCGDTPDSPFFHERVPPAPPGSVASGRRYEVLGLNDLYLAFAARSVRHPQFDAVVARLVTDAPLRLKDRGRRIVIEDAFGEPVGALSREASERWRPRLGHLVRARVAAIVIRRREDEPPAYQDALAPRTWAVVIPELVTDATEAT